MTRLLPGFDGAPTDPLADDLAPQEVPRPGRRPAGCSRAATSDPTASRSPRNPAGALLVWAHRRRAIARVRTDPGGHRGTSSGLWPPADYLPARPRCSPAATFFSRLPKRRARTQPLRKTPSPRTRPDCPRMPSPAWPTLPRLDMGDTFVFPPAAHLRRGSRAPIFPATACGRFNCMKQTLARSPALPCSPAWQTAPGGSRAAHRHRSPRNITMPRHTRRDGAPRPADEASVRPRRALWGRGQEIGRGASAYRGPARRLNRCGRPSRLGP